MSRCWDVANFCPLVVFVGGVRSWCSYSQCPFSGVWLLLPHTTRSYGYYVAVLLLGRIMHPARLSVCLSVRLSRTGS